MDLSDPRFNDPQAAREWLENQRWPNGPICPHCGNADASKIKALQGKAHRPGLYQCAECREQFTVTVGSVMERSKIPLHKWVAAMHLMGASKKGMSAHQLHRMLGIAYQSAWFLAHRIREAMREDGLAPMGGGEGGIVEADETYFGKAETHHISPARKGRPYLKGGHTRNNRPILALVERGGKVRTFHVPVADQATVQKIVKENIAKEARLHTDESRLYFGMDKHFSAHETVKHAVVPFPLPANSRATALKSLRSSINGFLLMASPFLIESIEVFYRNAQILDNRRPIKLRTQISQQLQWS